MSHAEETFDKKISAKSRLKSLQEDLTESNKIYKNLENTFEQLMTESSQIEQHKQQHQKPPSITFKKSISQ